MKKAELRDCLEKLGIPPYFYNLGDTSETDGRICMEKLGGEWHVFYDDGGVITTDEKFDTEEEACEFIYGQFCV